MTVTGRHQHIGGKSRLGAFPLVALASGLRKVFTLILLSRPVCLALSL